VNFLAENSQKDREDQKVNLGIDPLKPLPDLLTFL